MVEKPPTLKPGQKEHHLIAHDEVCFHANDLSRTEWVAGGKQPLRQKGQGRIVHVSDFIMERTGRLCLTESEREVQMRLPCAQKVEPTPAGPSKLKPVIETQLVAALNTLTINPMTTNANAKTEEAKAVTKGRKKGVKKEQKKTKGTPPDGPTEPIGTSAKGQTFAENSNWNPSASPTMDEGPY